jgi:hypothetical protein
MRSLSFIDWKHHLPYANLLVSLYLLVFQILPQNELIVLFILFLLMKLVLLEKNSNYGHKEESKSPLRSQYPISKCVKFIKLTYIL